MREEAKRRIEKEIKEKTGVLDLSNCEIKSIKDEIPEIQKMNWLKSLNISKNELSKINCLPKNLSTVNAHSNLIDEISNLPLKLKYLNLNSNRISKLENLHSSISILKINENKIRKLENLPQNLEMLSISDNILTNLENLPKKIIELDISGCNLREIKNLPHKIKILFAQHNRIEKVENISKSLLTVDLRHNKIKNLKSFLPLINQGVKVLIDEESKFGTGINLLNNPVESPPFQIIMQGNNKIINYFEELDKQGTAYLYEAKMLLIGEGGVGKTSLAFKLLDNNAELPNEEETTKGINTYPYVIEVETNKFCTINIWDFGGQEIYKATHQFFLTESSLYILIDDTRTNDKTLEDAKLYDWLETAKLFGANSPLILVQNEKSGRTKDIDFKGYKGNFDFVQSLHSFNFKTADGILKLEKDIKHFVTGLDHIGKAIPKKWLEVRNELIKLSKENPFISEEAYFIIYKKHLELDKSRAREWSKHLHHLGTLLHFQEDSVLKNIVILENEWATDAVYAVLDNEPIKKAKGHFTKLDVTTIWSESKYKDKVSELMALMLKFELCYELPDKKGNYLIPQLLPIQEPDNLEWDRNNNLQLKYRYGFMPKGIMSSIIVRLHNKIKDLNKAWAKGVVLEHNKTQALIKQNIAKKEISIRINGVHQKELMTIIIEEIDKINARFRGVVVSKEVPCICSACETSDTPHFLNTKKLKTRVEKKKKTIECRVDPFEDVVVFKLLDNLFEDYEKEYIKKQKRLAEERGLGSKFDISGDGHTFLVDSKLDEVRGIGGFKSKQIDIEKQEKKVIKGSTVIEGSGLKGVNIVSGEKNKQAVTSNKGSGKPPIPVKEEWYEKWWFISIAVGVLAFALSYWIIPDEWVDILSFPRLQICVVTGVASAALMFYFNPKKWLRRFAIAAFTAALGLGFVNIAMAFKYANDKTALELTITEVPIIFNIALIILAGVLVLLDYLQRNNNT